MAAVNEERMTPNLPPNGAVLFLIGVRINKPWKLHRWLPVFFAMPRMLRELAKQPERGLLGARTHFGFPNILVVQYWESFEKLDAYAKDRDSVHLPAWAAFNRRSAGSGDVGIWHETYQISSGAFESVYSNMPPYGLGKAVGLVPATGNREHAADRFANNDTSPDS